MDETLAKLFEHIQHLHIYVQSQQMKCKCMCDCEQRAERELLRVITDDAFDLALFRQCKIEEYQKAIDDRAHARSRHLKLLASKE